MLLKALREERDSLAERLGDCETELKRIHHSYAEMMNPDMAVGSVKRENETQRADFTVAEAAPDVVALKKAAPAEDVSNLENQCVG